MRTPLTGAVVTSPPSEAALHRGAEQSRTLTGALHVSWAQARPEHSSHGMCRARGSHLVQSERGLSQMITICHGLGAHTDAQLTHGNLLE